MPDTTTIAMNSTVSELHQDIRVLRAKLEDFCQSFRSGWNQTAATPTQAEQPTTHERAKKMTTQTP